MKIIRFFGGHLGADTITFRCSLSEASSPIQYWDEEDSRWRPTQYHCADARHRVSGMVRLCRELIADLCCIDLDQFDCQSEVQ